MAEMRKIGNFELLERIGQGGMGTVFKARQISLDRVVAVKVLPPSLAKHHLFIERFVREARASARLNHPNVVNGIDVGQDKDTGLYYFAMEYVDGYSVKDILAKKEKFNELQAAKIGKAMAAALAHAHAHGILHRDVKPDNILLDKHGTPKLCDLGLARLDSQTELEKGLTQQGQAVGTPHYISPEQARGARDLDPKTDLYSLGATLYHMLTGKTMFEGTTSIVVMTKHITDKAPHPNDAGATVGKGMLMVLAKLLAKDRADRYASAEMLAEDLDRLARGKLPRHADLPAPKWPFAGEAPGAAVPVKRPATAVLADRPRRTHRDTRGLRAVSVMPWYVPAGIALFVVAVGSAYLGFGSRRSHPASNADAMPGNSGAPAPAAEPRPALQAASLPGKGPGEAKVLPARVAPPPDVIGFKRPEPPVLRVAPKADSVGFAQPTATPARVAAPDTPPKDTAVAEEAGPQPDTKAKTPQPEPAPAAVPVPESDPSKAAPGPELANLISKALVLSAESKYREASDGFKLPPDKLKKFDAFDRELAKIHADGYAGLADMKPLIVEKLKQNPGKFEAKGVLSKTLGGKLAGGNDKVLYIRDKGVEVPYKWESLSLEELHALSSLVLRALPASLSLGLGVISYDQHTDKDDAFARKVLTGVNASGGRRILDLIDLRDKVLLAKKQAIQNAHAEKLFYELDEAMAAGRFTPVGAKGAQLKAKYADTEVLKARGAELDDMLETAKLALQSGATPQPGNVALASNGAVASGSGSPRPILDGNSTEYTGSSGFAGMPCPGEWIVTLPKLYLLREIRLLLWDGDMERYYRYQIDVSHDGETYTMVADRSKGEHRSWQVIRFPPRPVKAIKVKGLYNSVTSMFYAVELEAYCIPPDKPPTTTRGGAQPSGPPRPRPPGPPPKAPPPPPKDAGQ